MVDGPDIELWPGDCGAPRIYLSAANAPCLRLHGFDATGSLHTGTWSCFSGLRDEPSESDASPLGFAAIEPPDRYAGAIGPVGDDPSPDVGSDIAANDRGCALGRPPQPSTTPLLAALALAVASLRRVARPRSPELRRVLARFTLSHERAQAQRTAGGHQA